MFRSIVSLVVLGMLLVGLVVVQQSPASADLSAQATQSASGSGTAGVAIDSVRVRTLPNISAATLVILNAGDTVTAIGRNDSGTWVEVVTVANITGWAGSAFIKLNSGKLSDLPVVQPTPPTQSATQSACGPVSTGLTGRVNTPSLLVRSRADKTSSSIATLKAGDIVFILGASESGAWLLIQTQTGVTGWAGSAYIFLVNGKLRDIQVVSDTTTGAATPAAGATAAATMPAAASTACPTTTPTPGPTVKGKVDVAKLNVRSQPSNTSDVLEVLKAGDAVTILGASKTGAWFLIQASDGVIGWSGTAYIALTSGLRTDIPVVSDNAAPATEVATPAS
ncbi:MAG: SH3 domain-containing protein [Aggregatilineales bacterium]